MAKDKGNADAKQSALTIKVKAFELKNIQRGLEGLNGIASVELGLCRGRISRLIGNFLDDAISFTKTSEWQRIDKLIDDVNRKFCMKDDKGNPIAQNGKYVFRTEDMPALRDAHEELEKKEADAFALRKKMSDEYEELMKNEADVLLYTIPISLIQRIEKEYKELLKKPSPFSSETIDLLMAIIDMDK